MNKYQIDKLHISDNAVNSINSHLLLRWRSH